MRDIYIKAVLNGFIVTVGCSTVVFTSKTALVGELKRYLDDPEAIEQEYLGKAIFKPTEAIPGNVGQQGPLHISGERSDTPRTVMLDGQ